MGFDIAVYRTADRHRIGEPMPDDPDAYDDWVVRHDRMLLFDAPLGSGAAVHYYWSAPASRLGLPILASLYEVGFTQGVEVEGAALDQLSDELTKLVDEWMRMVDPAHMSVYVIGPHHLQVPLLADLMARAESLMAAVRIARLIDGFILIS